MAKKSAERVARGTLKEALGRISERLAKSKAMKPGDIVFRLGGQGGGNFVVECSEKEVHVAESAAAGADRSPLVEVIGDARRIHAILAGTKDAREQFLAGGFRVRGDLRYLSNVAMEVGIIKDPL
jgi:hypothetical protein